MQEEGFKRIDSASWVVASRELSHPVSGRWLDGRPASKRAFRASMRARPRRSAKMDIGADGGGCSGGGGEGGRHGGSTGGGEGGGGGVSGGEGNGGEGNGGAKGGGVKGGGDDGEGIVGEGIGEGGG